MNPRVQLRPAVTPGLSRAAFEAATPEGYAIALDGYVGTGPWFDPAGPRANFNHHEGVDRLATRATCAQVLMAIRQGLFDTFRDADGSRATLHVNDCDEDVCVSVALLRNAHLVAAASNPLVNRLVAMEDALDTTAGAYPFPVDLPVLRELAWVFEPYRRARFTSMLGRHRTPDALAGIIADVEHRILRHVTGSGGVVERFDTRYYVDNMGVSTTGWKFVREVGPYARTAMFADGVRAFVATRETGGQTGNVYTVGRMSPYVPFPVPEILDALNRAEFGADVPADCWGGSDMVGGSPRVAGSRLTQADVIVAVQSVVEGWNVKRRER